jgi:hypothetical protein
MGVVGFLHGRLDFKRRTPVLAKALANAIPTTARTVLDGSCGDGSVAPPLGRQRPELSLTGGTCWASR